MQWNPHSFDTSVRNQVVTNGGHGQTFGTHLASAPEVS
ncbi:unnamed protein product [Larinioides sclopetarius]|uniref:Uncharacterized protein n=1 Tax=Larinioides sclopetarius TaxID=280406 RepID=A0AAV2BB83_9ARAC